jgi:hypothetical protein
MPYRRYFQLADDLITHLQPIVGGIADPFIVTRYTGFVAVSAVTVYELAIKDIFIKFAGAKHKILGTFTESYFDRINGRIKVSNLRDDYIAKFGDKYLLRFNKKLAACERVVMLAQRKSVSSSYGNLIKCRHDFAHEGVISANMSFPEIVDSYELGKEVIHCLAKTMQR